MRVVSVLVLLAAGCGKDEVDLESDTDTDTDVVAEPLTKRGCDERHEAFIAALEADLAASDAPGVSAAIMEGGVVTCEVSRGTLEHQGSEPVTVDSLFQIGSTTKLFTSIAALQQVEAGRYTTQSTLAETYPSREFAQDEGWNDAITVDHLLSQQAGLYDYFDWQASADDADLKAWSDTFLFGRLWLMSPPGAFWNYSNANLTAAGLVVETQDPAGRTYRDIMAEDVFAPLGMTRTVQGNDRADELGNVASGYGLAIEGQQTVERAVQWDEANDPAHGRPAGANTWSTPHDVLQAARLLVDGDDDVLSDPLRRTLSTRHVGIPDSPTVGYGYGLFVYDGFQLGRSYYDAPLWSHGGNTLSYTSEFYVLPEQEVAVSVLSSGYGQTFGNAVVAALELGELPAPVSPPTRSFDASKLDLHVGDYEDAFNWGAMTVARDGDELTASMPDLVDLGIQVSPKLQTMTDATFVATVDGQPFAFTFVGDGVEPSAYMVNRSAVGTRIDAPQSAVGTDERDRQTLGQVRAWPLLGPGRAIVDGPYAR